VLADLQSVRLVVGSNRSFYVRRHPQALCLHLHERGQDPSTSQSSYRLRTCAS
jgi:hypothetical protein